MENNTLSRRELKKKETRQKLVSIALELFNKEGVEQTGMRQLAKASNLGIGTYYNYFKTKDEIIFTIFEDIFKDLFNDTPHIDKDMNLETNLIRNFYEKIIQLATYEELLKQFIQSSASLSHFQKSDSIAWKKISSSISNFWGYVRKILVEHDIEVESREETLSRIFWTHFMSFNFNWMMDDSENKHRAQDFMTNTMKVIVNGV